VLTGATATTLSQRNRSLLFSKMKDPQIPHYIKEKGYRRNMNILFKPTKEISASFGAA
jgi:hypothetical protein